MTLSESQKKETRCDANHTGYFTRLQRFFVGPRAAC